MTPKPSMLWKFGDLYPLCSSTNKEARGSDDREASVEHT